MDIKSKYITLLKACISNTIYGDPPMDPWSNKTYDPKLREGGLDWPSLAHTMIGSKRLDNLQYCCEEVIGNNIPGDFVECGVWRGGATILMTGIAEIYNEKNRKIWVCDSFEGLPAPNPELYPSDKDDKHFEYEELSVSLENVKENFKKYGLLNENVTFLRGWFKDTLKGFSSNNISVLRADADLYESTTDILTNLYNKVSNGGFVIIDDFHAIEACKKATMDFRNSNSITEKIQEIDGVGVYWQKLN